MSAPPTRADLSASSGGHHCGSRARRPISRTQRRANGRGYIFSSCPGVRVAGGCSDSSSRSHTGAIRSGVFLKTLPSTRFPDRRRIVLFREVHWLYWSGHAPAITPGESSVRSARRWRRVAQGRCGLPIQQPKLRGCAPSLITRMTAARRRLWGFLARSMGNAGAPELDLPAARSPVRADQAGVRAQLLRWRTVGRGFAKARRWCRPAALRR